MKKSGPPRHLSAAAKRLWSRLRDDFTLDDEAALLLLRQLCEASDRANEARRQILADGMLVADRFGQQKAHPLLAVERDARGQVLAAVRALRLAPEDVA